MFNLKEIDCGLLNDFRATLNNCGYNSETIRGRIHESPKSFQKGTIVEAAYEYLFDSDRRLLMLIKLFLSRQVMTHCSLLSLFPRHMIHFLVDIGVLEARFDGDYQSRVLLSPFERYHFVTDAFGDLFSPADRDAVLELVGEQDILASVLLRDRCNTALDLCTGSGVFAILASEYCDRVWGADINPRAINFARFNALLNAVSNVTFLESDVYGAVEGLTFDVIFANPPYNPSCGLATPARLSIHGGFSGEEIFFRILAGLQNHLRSGGLAHIISRFFYDDHPSFASRIAGVLDAERLDMLLLQSNPRQIFTLSHMIAATMSVGTDGLATLCDYYKSRGIERESFGILNIQHVNNGGAFRTINLNRLTGHDLRALVRDHLLASR